MTRRDVIHSAVAFMLCLTGFCLAGDPPPLPEGCQPCLHPLSGGHIDWTDGYVVATGVGKARGTTKKDRLGAKRAGKIIAIRNALAIATGIPIDGDSQFANIQNGQVRLRGLVKGHETTSVDWRPNTKPPECQVTIRVPLWGVTGVASLVYSSQRQKSMRAGQARLPLDATGSDNSDEVLIVDARGTGTEPCLFARVVTPDNHVLYDVSTVTTTKDQEPTPPVRYVESNLSFDELRSSVLRPETSPLFAGAGRFSGNGACSGREDVSSGSQNGDTGRWMLCVLPEPPKPGHAGPAIVTTTQPANRVTSQPTTQPSNTKRRTRRVVRAIKVSGADKTQVVLTREDAEKLRKDPKTANLLRNGKVVVVVDSVAAGIEGSLPAWQDGTRLAFTEAR